MIFDFLCDIIIIGRNLDLFSEGDLKYGKFVSGVYIVNVIFQSFFSLVCPMALGALFAWLFVERAGGPAFLYPILIVLGTVIGLFSMVRFILTTMQAVERLEREAEERARNQKKSKRNDH